VDTAIAGIRALLAKHDRIKIGLLQDLLTRGVDREGRLRDPAEEKFKTTPLDQVPCEWRVSNLGSVSNKITSGSRGWAAYYANEGALFLRIGNLTRRHVNLRWVDTQFVRLPSSSEGKRTAVELKQFGEFGSLACRYGRVCKKRVLLEIADERSPSNSAPAALAPLTNLA
jgi:type I restriction enzyme S subunit